MAYQNPDDFADDGFWDAPDVPASQATSSYTGSIPQGFTQADVDDFLRRNPGDTHRVGEALVRGPQASAAPMAPSGGAPGGPQSIQPFGGFSFDTSKFGQTDGFKFKFDKAMQAIQRAGAAGGKSIMHPQVWKAMQEEATGLASQDINDEFGRQASTYGMNFDTHAWNEGNRFNSQRTNRLDDWSFMDADRRFGRGVLESDRGFGYQQDRDRIGDTWRFIDYGYGATPNPR